MRGRQGRVVEEEDEPSADSLGSRIPWKRLGLLVRRARARRIGVPRMNASVEGQVAGASTEAAPDVVTVPDFLDTAMARVADARHAIAV